MELTRYCQSDRSAWDEFLENSINGHFMHYRNYMEYHSSRFIDHSLLFWEKNEICAIFPANQELDTLYSHQGLTFGGLLVSQKSDALFTLEAFNELKKYLSKNKINRLVYKRVPDIFNSDVFQDDLYALWRIGAKRTQVNLNSVVELRKENAYSKGRKSSIKKALRSGVSFRETRKFENFWKLVTDVLKKHDATPTHTLQEISLLQKRFPEQIKLYVAFLDDALLAGCLCFVAHDYVHTQYLASSNEGKKYCALDGLIDHVMKKYSEKTFFNFGISTEEGGTTLNEGLYQQKKGFGARATIFETYELQLND